MLKNKYFYLSLLLLITLFFYYDYRVSNLKSERQSIRDNLSSITKDYDILKKNIMSTSKEGSTYTGIIIKISNTDFKKKKY